jgi:lysozyme
MTVLGLDVAYCDDDNSTPQQIDFHKMKAAGTEFVFIRTGQDVYQDSDFVYNWREAKAAGLIRGAYWVFDYRHGPVGQATKFLQVLGDDCGELPLTIDCEIVQAWGMPLHANIIPALQSFMAAIDDDRPAILYTNPDMLLHVIHPAPDWLIAHPLWIAHYGTSTPCIGDWKSWRFWQYSAHGDGLAFGLESRDADLDSYNGSLDDLRVWAGLQQPAPTIEERVEKLEQAAMLHGWEV